MATNANIVLESLLWYDLPLLRRHRLAVRTVVHHPGNRVKSASGTLQGNLHLKTMFSKIEVAGSPEVTRF